MEKEIVREKMQWYAVRTMNNRENKVMERFIKEIDSTGFNNLIGRTIIPTEKIPSMKAGKKILRERVLYPGYIFIETCAKGEIERILKGIDGTPGFVRTRDGSISPMKQREIDQILVMQEETNSKELKDIYSVGEEVEVVDGAFSTFKGKISKIDNERVTINVSIFGRPTPVDLTILQIKKV